MNPEARQCQNCKKDFAIEPEDFVFYEKINVPPPTFCPNCRLQRRLMWLKGLDLFKRKCNLCGEVKLSVYEPDAPYTVYCDRCWWSDKWSPHDFAQEYDPSRPFFEQWRELLHKTPLLGLSMDKITSELSPYTNHVGNSKNCYLVFYSDQNEDSANSYQLTQAKNIYDSADIMETDGCYDSSNVYKSYNIAGATGNNRSCYDSYFIRDCESCHDCFGLSSARSKAYVFMGEQLSKEEYEKRMSEIDLGSYEQYQYWKKKADEYFKTVSPRPAWDTLSVNCTGSYVFQSRNCKECYNITSSEDCKYLTLIKLGPVKDSYDYTDWGDGAERIYDSVTVGDQSRDVFFTSELGFGISYVEYSKLSAGASHHFGCVSVRKTNYCILNKQYSKEEYEKLRAQIVQDMKDKPYISANGHTYRYGEFFPPEFSPHAYNDTLASKMFPLSKEAVEKAGMRWYTPEAKEYAVTIAAADLPDNIKDAPETILKEIMSCITCSRGYRVIPQELQYLQKHSLPLPRQCPFCRIGAKIDHWVENMTLHDRTCGKCGNAFKTHYSEAQAPVILCKECYQAEVM
jgi:Zn ribbon nucleic-acid-binding protein